MAGQAKKRGTLAERQRAAIESRMYTAQDHGQGTWRHRIADAEYFFSAMQDVAADKQIGEDITGPYSVVLKHVWDIGYAGACHSTSAILYVLLSEKGLAPKLCIGEIRSDEWIFDHSWVEVEGNVFDVAIGLPLPGGAPAGGPVFASVDLKTGDIAGVHFGIADGQGLDGDALIPRRNTLEGYAEVQRQMEGVGSDIWSRIAHLAPLAGLDCTVEYLIAKYGNDRREYRFGDTSMNSSL